jgi:VanZ family protein
MSSATKADDSMPKLRFPWVWWAPGWLLVIGVCVGSLLPSRMLPDIFDFDDKLRHAGAYLLLMVWFGGIVDRDKHLILAAALVLLGIALDTLQLGVPSRTFSLSDVAANLVGIAAGLALLWFRLAGWCQRVERYFFA